eukprot:37845-Chlamydomonas_euryale.AAC.3
MFATGRPIPVAARTGAYSLLSNQYCAAVSTYRTPQQMCYGCSHPDAGSGGHRKDYMDETHVCRRVRLGSSV